MEFDETPAEWFLSYADGDRPLDAVWGHPAYRDVVQPHADLLGRDLDREAVRAAMDGRDTAFGDVSALAENRAEVESLLSLVEAPVAEIYAAETAGNQYVAATVEFETGVVATLTASRVTQQKVRTLSVTAEDCRVTVDYMAQSVRINRHSLPEYVETDGDVRYRHENVIERPTVDNGEPLKKELASFVETARTGGEPVVSAADGIRALEFVRRVTEVAAAE